MQQPGLARLAALAAWVLLGQPLTLPLNIKGHGSAWLVARALAKHAHQPRPSLARAWPAVAYPAVWPLAGFLCPVALTGHVSVGYVSVEIPRRRPCPLTGLSVNRLEPLNRCPTQPVAIQHILSPAASPLAVAVVWARAPDLPPSHRRHRRRGQGAPPPVDPPPLPGSVYWSFIAVKPFSSSGLTVVKEPRS